MAKNKDAAKDGTKGKDGKKGAKKSGRPSLPVPEAIYEWRILVRQTAAGVGALCGLVSLLYGAPAWVACVRGGGASFLIAVLGRQGERFLSSSDRTALADERSESPSTPSPGTAPAPAAAATVSTAPASTTTATER